MMQRIKVEQVILKFCEIPDWPSEGTCLSHLAPIKRLHCLRLARGTVSTAAAMEIKLAKLRTSAAMLLGMTWRKRRKYVFCCMAPSFRNCVLLTFREYCISFAQKSVMCTQLVRIETTENESCVAAEPPLHSHRAASGLIQPKSKR